MKRQAWKWLIQLAVLAFLGCYAALTGCSSEVQISRLTLMITGFTEGYIANCGCALGQYGGLKRMARLIGEERTKARKQHPQDKGRAAEAVLIDVGDFTDYSTDVSRINSSGVVRGMATMDYDMVGLGLEELSYPQVELWELMGESGLPLTAANLNFTAPPEGEDCSAKLNALVEPYRIVKLESGYRVGMIHVVDENVSAVIGKLNGFELTDAAAAARRILDQHAEDADFWLLSIADPSQHGTNPESIARLAELTLVVGFHDNNPFEPPDSIKAVFPRFVRGPITKAKEVLRVTTFFNTKETPPVVISERLSVPETIKPDEKIDAIIAELAPRLEQLELERNQEATQKEVHPFYIGHDTCRYCHGEIANQMLKTRHPQAMLELVLAKQSGSAACLPCHVVGHASLPGVKWSGGWNIIDQQSEMEGVFCESCHGPGEYHVELMKNDGNVSKLPPEIRDNLTAEGRNAVGLQPADEYTCLVCHDKLNSPDFNFEEYWAKIEH